MWYATNLVLWALVTPLCTLVAIGIEVSESKVATTALTVVWIATVPLGALGFSGWVGVRYPYHVQPLAGILRGVNVCKGAPTDAERD